MLSIRARAARNESGSKSASDKTEGEAGIFPVNSDAAAEPEEVAPGAQSTELTGQAQREAA